MSEEVGEIEAFMDEAPISSAGCFLFSTTQLMKVCRSHVREHGQSPLGNPHSWVEGYVISETVMQCDSLQK